MVKCEASTGRRGLSMDDCELRVPVKRRRREPLTQSTSCSNLLQESQLGDQSTTASPVKRSSRFRGVSRFAVMP